MKYENKKTGTDDGTSKLVERFQAGKVSATIFSKELSKDGKKFTVYAIKVSKSYTQDEGKTWKETNNYQKEELQNLQVVISEAAKYLYLKE